MECLDCEIVNTVSKGITAANAAVVLVLCTVHTVYADVTSLLSCAVSVYTDAACVVDKCCCCNPCIAAHLCDLS